MGGTPPISKALRCGGGAALLLRKEWRAAKVRISFVVQRRCCPFSALELKRWRAANACEAGPRRLAVSLHLGMGGPHGVHGGCGRRVSHCAEEGRGPGTHTIFRLRAEGLPTLFHRSILGERMLPNKVTSARGIHAMPAGVVGVGAYTLHSFSLEILARTCWGRDYPDMTQETNPPGTLRKERRTFLPLATIQPRAERTPTSCLTYAGGTRPRGRTLGRVAWGERKPWLSTAAHSGSHTAPSPGGLPAVRDRGEVRP